MSFAQANAALTDMTHRARARRTWCRENGQADEQFVGGLIREFREESVKHPAGAGSVHMALSLARLIDLQDQVAQLTEALQMRESALQMMFKLSDDRDADAEH
jgi:hypothetical protein